MQRWIQVMEFINHMNLDPDEIVSVEDIAPPSEDGTVVLTFGHPRSGANGQRLSTLTRKLSGENSPAQTMLESSERINQQNNSWIHSVSAPFVECIVQNALCLLRTVYKLLTQYLDLFGKPSREFLKKLFPFAEEPSSVVFFLLTSFNRFGWRLEIFFPKFQWNDWPPRCPFCSRKVQVFQEKSNNSQLQKLQDIMEKVAIAELTLDRKSEDGGWEGSHEEEEHLIRGKNTW